ncbi:hypothetical protein LSTR_LSTR003857 [Laodelphax striatellus]|uniref:DUF7869 domain-containing protein n=1 Tax=Laodelphax striatellus TaxID=195883 RepID=A0A482XER9_LAOST|nr:hypothetical protein LSTR_LSTR003857 [Laodelphax striatellus]
MSSSKTSTVESPEPVEPGGQLEYLLPVREMNSEQLEEQLEETSPVRAMEPDLMEWAEETLFEEIDDTDNDETYQPEEDSDTSDEDYSIMHETKIRKLSQGKSNILSGRTEAEPSNDLKRQLSPVSSNLIVLEPKKTTEHNKEENEPRAALGSSDSQATPTKSPKRWRKSRPETWKRNIEKSKCIKGLPYKSIKGKEQRSKIPKPVDCSKCKFECTVHFTEVDRSIICRAYWNLQSYERQKEFILCNVKSSAPKSRRPRKEDAKLRSNTKAYYMQKNNESVRVCQKFFCSTLCISNIPILTAFAGKDNYGNFTASDRRGHKEPPNKTSTEDFEHVKKHIQSFPCVESHYTRKSTKRKYLDKNLNITKMYNLYKSFCEQEELTPVSLITYRRIFGKHFNLSFFVPKKDQCLTCSIYENSNDEERMKLENSYREHLSRKSESMISKQKDKERADSDTSYMSVSFDMQSVLQIPTSDVSIMYYMRKLNMYNLTIYESPKPNQAYCYLWTEVNGKRGSCEVGSCLYHYIKNLSTEIKEISLYSDTCGGQNRNLQICALMLFLIKTTKLSVIEHKFMESGHSYMEVDSMHSAIEREKKHIDVFSVHEWINVMKQARSTKATKPPYNVKELRYNDFFDLKKLSTKLIKNKSLDTDGNKVNWLKIKCFRYEASSPNVIFYRYDYSGLYKCLDVATTRRNKKDE